MNRIAYSTSTSQARMRVTGKAGMLAVAAATLKAGASTSTCPMHNCAMPVQFKQAEGEAPGVGRWSHVDSRLDPNPMTGFGHVVPAGVK